MRAQPIAAAETTAHAHVVSQALLRAADVLGVSTRELGAIVGISAAQVSRIRGGQTLAHGSKPYQLAAAFVRLFRALYPLAGGDEQAMRRWFHADNAELVGVPAELARDPMGLATVVNYLDGYRARI
jgi:hypothetical protein